MWNFILCEYFNKNEKESSIQSEIKSKRKIPSSFPVFSAGKEDRDKKEI